MGDGRTGLALLSSSTATLVLNQLRHLWDPQHGTLLLLRQLAGSASTRAVWLGSSKHF